MKRNKYLDDLGIPINSYGTNWISNNDKRQKKWKKERKKYGFDERETWNLNRTFYEWLYSHLMMYLEVNCINLSYHKFNFDGKEYTQEEAINFIINKLKTVLLLEDDWSKEADEAYKELKTAIRLWAEILPCMWW